MAAVVRFTFGLLVIGLVASDTPAPNTPAPGTATPAPNTPAPASGTPAPSTPAPATGTPAPSTPAPATGTPAPSTPAPATGTPAPATPAPPTPAPDTTTMSVTTTTTAAPMMKVTTNMVVQGVEYSKLVADTTLADAVTTNIKMAFIEFSSSTLTETDINVDFKEGSLGADVVATMPETEATAVQAKVEADKVGLGEKVSSGVSSVAGIDAVTNGAITTEITGVSATAETEVTCFPGESTVQVHGRGSVALHSLQAGNSVLVDGQQHEPVLSFLHLNMAVPSGAADHRLVLATSF